MIKSLRLNNFRNYKNLEVNINSRMNFLIGDNGEGKTNFLEAIYLLSFFKSFRKSGDKELINKESDFYYIKGIFSDENISKIELGFDKQKRLVKIDSNNASRLKDAIGKFGAVLFTDTDIELILGPPSFRRKYLDATLSVCDPSYLDALYAYVKVLSMRNASIREFIKKKCDKNAVFAWNDLLVKNGIVLIKKRKQLVSQVSKVCSLFFPEFTKGAFKMELSYVSSADCEYELFLKQLEKGFDRDLKFLHTTTGPHRDDFLIKAGRGAFFKSFASKGQIRSSSLILKLAQMEYIEKERALKSILLLDDVLLDLDKRNKKLFLEIIGDERQCFFTSTSFNEFQGMEGDYFFVKSAGLNVI